VRITFADERYVRMLSAPEIRAKSLRFTREYVPNAAPCAFLHIEQWQWLIAPSGPRIS
jgi:hypothetical protein